MTCSDKFGQISQISSGEEVKYEEEFDIRSTGPILQRRIRFLLNICMLHFTLLINNFCKIPSLCIRIQMYRVPGHTSKDVYGDEYEGNELHMFSKGFGVGLVVLCPFQHRRYLVNQRYQILAVNLLGLGAILVRFGVCRNRFGNLCS